ncbi:MAG TPA: AAA family ATPase [Pseudonocardiaceae bacterium]|nr:AAA family ATPase [Pseudonocardiaceae bacterium]
MREGKLAEFDAFCNRMRLDDYLLTTSQGKTYLGRVAGEATYTLSSDRRSNLRREVEWLNTTRPVPFANLPQPLPAKLHSQADIVELTNEITAIERLLETLGVADRQLDVAPAKELRFPEVGQDLAEELLIDQEWLRQLTDLLWERQQLILYGPPGTGKTYLARKLAEHLCGPSAMKLVQFHPVLNLRGLLRGFPPGAAPGWPAHLQAGTRTVPAARGGGPAAPLRSLHPDRRRDQPGEPGQGVR